MTYSIFFTPSAENDLGKAKQSKAKQSKAKQSKAKQFYTKIDSALGQYCVDTHHNSVRVTKETVHEPKA